MINVEVKIDTSKFDRMMADLPDHLAAARRRALSGIAQEVKTMSVLSFRSEQHRPSPWAPRKSGGKHPLLIRSGKLRQSIAWRLEGDDLAVVYSDSRYAAYHQHGTKRMPARPFFPVDRHGSLVDAIKRKINNIVGKALSHELVKL